MAVFSSLLWIHITCPCAYLKKNETKIHINYFDCSSAMLVLADFFAFLRIVSNQLDGDVNCIELRRVQWKRWMYRLLYLCVSMGHIQRLLTEYRSRPTLTVRLPAIYAMKWRDLRLKRDSFTLTAHREMPLCLITSIQKISVSLY